MDRKVTTTVLAWHRRCLTGDTTVLRLDGSWSYIKDLHVGDKLLTWVEGEYVEDEVTDVFCTGIRETLTAQARGFLSVRATPDHEFLMNVRGRNHYFDEVQRTRAGRHGTLYAGHNTGTGNQQIEALLAGYLIADGSVTPKQSPKFTSNSPAMLDRVERMVKHLFDINAVRTAKGNGWDMHFPNGTKGGGETPNPVKEWMRSEGSLALKRERRVPKFLWQADAKTIGAFFTGVIDSDGSLELKSPAGASSPSASIKIHAGLCYELALDYYYLLAKLGVRVSSVKNAKGCWTLLIGEHDQAQELLSWLDLGHEAKAFLAQQMLSAPKRKAREQSQDTYYAEIKTERNSAPEEVWDISTKRHQFFANGYLVHNCGKDEVALHSRAMMAMSRVGNYWHMLPKQEQARKALWESVNPRTGRVRWKDAFPEEIIQHVDNQAMRLTFKNNSSWQLLGSDNYQTLVGTTPVDIVNSEAALSDPSAFAFFRPILLENKGTSLHISSTRGRNHFYNMFRAYEKVEDAFCERLSAEDTDVFTAAQLAEERAMYIDLYGSTQGNALFEQEYLSSWDAANIGAVFGHECAQLRKDGRALPLTYDPRYPVNTSWDLGVGDTNVILFWQDVGNISRLIDWYASSDTGIEHYAEVLAQKRYFYHRHVGPHDIANREWGNNGATRIATAKKLGINFDRMPNISKADSIAAAARLLRTMQINVSDLITLDPYDDCSFVLDAFEQYSFKYDKEKRVMSKVATHDWTSHYNDALMSYAVYKAGTESVGTQKQRLQGTGQQIETFDNRRLRDIMRGRVRTGGAFG